MAKIRILMNMRLIQINQKMPPIRGIFQQALDLGDEGRSAFRIRTSQQLLGFLPGKLQPLQCPAERFTSTAPAELLLDPVRQPF
jgi:hypothetical protein